MTHSKLATYVSHSPNHSGKRNHKIDTLTPHYMDGNLSIETCAQVFKPTSRRASSNYGIGSDGRIGVYVEEENRAWTSGSSANDNRAITFECANLSGGKLSDACWKSLVKLCADICKRYGYKGVYYCGRADYSQLPRGYMLLTMHRWFQDTDCPGPWLSKQFSRLAKEVNAAIGAKPSSSTVTSTNDKEAFPMEQTITVKSDAVNVRTAPSTKTGKIVTSNGKPVRYSKGDKVNIDGVVLSDGLVWGTYIGGASGKRRYVAIGPMTIMEA